VWKIEGLDRRDDCAALVAAARRDGRDKVGRIILGRGSNEAGIIGWLRAAAPVPGFIGFAVGRTSFWDALVALRDNKTTREKAVETIADRYVGWVRTFEDARRADHDGGKGREVLGPAPSTQPNHHVLCRAAKRCHHHGSVLERPPAAREAVQLPHGLFHRATTRKWIGTSWQNRSH
jgi:hypothetical protein